MNHFDTFNIFFFAEDTNIFGNGVSFTQTIEQISKDASDTHKVIKEVFRVMNIPSHERIH